MQKRFVRKLTPVTGYVIKYPGIMLHELQAQLVDVAAPLSADISKALGLLGKSWGLLQS